MKRVLMIAYHFPPLAGSSGIQRTLRFVQHLPTFGWQPAVLTTQTLAYERTSPDLLGDVPAGVVVRRAFAVDTARHLQLGGRYMAAMARPDRWISWRFDGVRQGMALVREFKPDVIWSTYPIATAHVIASALHRATGIPWIADFRDPMAQDGYPTDAKVWASYLRIEQDAIRRAQLCVFTTPSAARLYQERYPEAAQRIVVVENGYDEESFQGVMPARQAATATSVPARPLLLLHSGVVYPSERDPTQFLVALGRLKQRGLVTSETLRVRFRAPVHDELLRQLAKQHGAADLIEISPAIAYREALAEMMSVDALLVMQASNCNAQIPAKLYEYLRAGRPILGLTDRAGDTAWVLRNAGLQDIVAIDSVTEIERRLPEILKQWQLGIAERPNEGVVSGASRRGRAQALASLLTGAVGSPLRSQTHEFPGLAVAENSTGQSP